MFTIEIFLMKFKEFLIQLLHYHSIPIKIEALNLLDDKDALYLNENRILIVLKNEFITQSQLNELENYCRNDITIVFISDLRIMSGSNKLTIQLIGSF